MTEICFNINGTDVKGQAGETILQVAKRYHIDIPTLCHNEKVKAYGACGLCVVEIEGQGKLFRACATVIGNGMQVKTNTTRVAESRKTALDFLLSDHTGDCRPPCVLACPAGTDCQGYVGLIANGEFEASLELIKDRIPLPASIGRVCPHPCETACRRKMVEEPVAIAWLKRFAADRDLEKETFVPELAPASGKTVAIIGGGPGGLSSAYFLARMGHKVTIYDFMPKMGGMLRYGIPEYRLPKNVVDEEIAVIEKMGVELKNNVKIGKDITLESLRGSYDAVIVAIGAWVSRGMRCKGEDLDGVVGGIDFLRGVALKTPMDIGEKVAVVGGGNTAMDACRTAVRLGAKEVNVIYRRTKAEMPADLVEIEEAEEEGVVFKYLTNPLEFIADDGAKVNRVRLQKMELGEPDASGRRSPVPIPGEEEMLEVDTVIMAIGQGTDPAGFEGIELSRRGTLLADESTFMTNMDGVFAIGDATNKGASIAVEAIGEAQKSALIIDRYLAGETVSYKKPYGVEREVTPADLADKPKHSRPVMAHVPAETRKHNFEEFVLGYTEEQAVEEASRCLGCGCHDYYECKLVHYANQYDVKPERIAGEKHHRTVADTHPYILRNPDKCILCGLCVRGCEEVMGSGALGLVDRGFDSIVKPAMDQDLAKTDCVSCGLCVSLCPTGALLEKQQVAKEVPVEEESTVITCPYCPTGCQIDLRFKGNMVTRALPVEGGLLCALGRFGLVNEKNGKVSGKCFIPSVKNFTPIEEDMAARLVPGIPGKQLLKGLEVVSEKKK